jgi:hypothetical protein
VHGHGDRGVSADQFEGLVPRTPIVEQGGNDRGDIGAGDRAWAVIEKATGEFLGWFHFRPRADAVPGEVELGYRLRKSAWGKGYATERGLVERRAVVYLHDRRRRDHRVLGEGAEQAHLAETLATGVESVGAVELRRADCPGAAGKPSRPPGTSTRGTP